MVTKIWSTESLRPRPLSIFSAAALSAPGVTRSSPPMRATAAPATAASTDRACSATYTTLTGRPRALTSLFTAAAVALISAPPSRWADGSLPMIESLTDSVPPTTHVFWMARSLKALAVAAGMASLSTYRIG